MHKLSTLFHLLNYYSIWTKTERVYISIRYINSEQIPRFSHESRFEFLSEIDRRAERERVKPVPPLSFILSPLPSRNYSNPAGGLSKPD